MIKPKYLKIVRRSYAKDDVWWVMVRNRCKLDEYY